MLGVEGSFDIWDVKAGKVIFKHMFKCDGKTPNEFTTENMFDYAHDWEIAQFLCDLEKVGITANIGTVTMSYRLKQ